MIKENLTRQSSEKDLENPLSGVLETKEQIMQVADMQPFVFKRASRLAVIGYESARLGAEICFGILPEAY